MPRIFQEKLGWLLALVVFSGLCSSGFPAKEPKLTAEEIVAKHLAAIGSPEARAAVRSRAVTGDTKAIFRLGAQGTIEGKGLILSEGRKLRLDFKFNVVDYPGEQIVYDGEKVNVGQIRPGVRSQLSAFLYTYDICAKEGFLGGALSTAWPLLDLSSHPARLDYTGIKKIEGRQLHEIKYKAKKGSADLAIALYFDPETFRHIRTQYRLVRPSQMVSNPSESAGMRDTIFTLWETFDNFKEVEGLTLPQFLKLDFTIEGQAQTVMSEWDFAVTQIAHNQQIDPKYFKIMQ